MVIFFCLGAFGGEFILSLCFSEVLKKDFFKYAKVLFLLKIGEILKTVPSMREEQDDIYVRV